VIVVTGDELLSWCQAQAGLALMDYVSPVGGLDGVIGVEAVNLEDIDRAVEAHRMFAGFTPYPPGYEESLACLKDRLLGSPSGLLQVKVLTGDESGTFRVVAGPRRAATRASDYG
jgi:hypothetical protein